MQPEIKCVHACRNSCAMLNEALKKEAAMVRYYEGIYSECNFPEVKTFLEGIIDQRRNTIEQLIQKLNEIHVRSQVLDGIFTSFNNIDG